MRLTRPCSTRPEVVAAFLLVVATSATAAPPVRPSYDQQVQTYYATRLPASVSGKPVTLTPIFSPDTTLVEFVNMINSAQKTLDIGTPGWSSWVGCTNYDPGSVIGCTVSKMRNQETFPIWAATLNAVYRGVRVRLLTNNYNTPASPGLIEPLSFLRLAGATVVYYRSTTYMHAKYMMVDGKRVSISSVNFSRASTTRNREAGVVIEGDGAQPLLDYCTAVFEADLQAGEAWPVQTYNATDMAIIKDPTPVPQPPVKPQPMCADCYVAPRVPVTSTGNVSVTTSPDAAFSFVTRLVNATQQSLRVEIYQITDPALCYSLVELHRRGVNVTLLVSKYIYDDADFYAAQKCYVTLHEAGLRIRRTFAANYYQYSHQKFWIVDGHTVVLSTGNWSPSDYPTRDAGAFPPYGNDDWLKVNRDYTVSIRDPQVVAQFTTLMDADYAVGDDWQPPAALSQSLRAGGAAALA